MLWPVTLQAVEARADMATMQSKIKEMEHNLEDMRKDQNVSVEELKAQAQKKEQELMALQREHENKVCWRTQLVDIDY